MLSYAFGFVRTTPIKNIIKQSIQFFSLILIDQVVGEITVSNVYVICELEKNWINRLQYVRIQSHTE